MPVEVGREAPDFSLVDTERQPRRLSDYRGNNVVLAFFPGAFTSGCTKEMCSIRDNLERFNSLHAQVLAVSVDPPFVQKVFADQNGLNFPLLSDYKREAVREYDVPLPNLMNLDGYIAARRSVFVVDKNGTVRYTWVAPQGVSEPEYEEITRVLNALQ